MTKICTHCQIEKLLEEFGYRSGRKDGLNSWCKQCCNDKSRAWRKNNPDKVKEQNSRRTREDRYLALYGITIEEYQETLEKQNFKCAICEKPAEENTKGILYVDHIAGTKQMRGLLCNLCNTAIGLMNHDTFILLNAVNYLNQHGNFR